MSSDVIPKQEVAVRRFGAPGSEVAVFEFEGQLRDLIISNLHQGFLATGTYAADARSLAPQSVQALAFAGTGALASAASASFSSTLFMATANPATLMQLSSGGVGSAVMGVNGIVAQAGFIPVAASLPVVAPIIAMQAIQTAIILHQFKQVDRKLDAIKGTLDQSIARSEATHAGELIAASETVDEVYRQYEIAGSFSQDMLIRLALAERDLRTLARRFRFLVDSQAIRGIDDIEGVQRANYDAHSAMLSSFLELRISYLRVCVDMELNPAATTDSIERLKGRIASGIEFWETMLQRSESLRHAIKEREEKLNDMNWAERALPEFVGGRGAAVEKKLKALQAAYVSTLESELKIVKGFDSLIRSAKDTLKELEGPPSLSSSPTLVYWQDEAGEHSFATDQFSVESLTGK